MRGYFGIGVEGVSKPQNVSNLFRAAHAFGASFVFTVAASYGERRDNADTSDVLGQLPYHQFEDLGSIAMSEGGGLVGVELLNDALELPSFRHPRRAAYVLGPERGQVSDALLECCDHVIRIPTRICLNSPFTKSALDTSGLV